MTKKNRHSSIKIKYLMVYLFPLGYVRVQMQMQLFQNMMTLHLLKNIELAHPTTVIYQSHTSHTRLQSQMTFLTTTVEKQNYLSFLTHYNISDHFPETGIRFKAHQIHDSMHNDYIQYTVNAYKINIQYMLKGTKDITQTTVT